MAFGFGMSRMDVMNFLKTVPAAVGIAGLLTHFLRVRQPGSDHEVLNIIQSARTTFVVLACAALIGLTVWLFVGPVPPDHDAALSEEHSPGAKQSSLTGVKWFSPISKSLSPRNSND